jgi:hypothetical protein
LLFTNTFSDKKKKAAAAGAGIQSLAAEPSLAV